jgi:2-polyprenyl-3-methyl-5-hydroxy-6-metoxy-1,4-benzoquinol methylase
MSAELRRPKLVSKLLGAAAEAPVRRYRAAMAEGSYHDRLWEQLPEGCDPTEFELRLAFLLERATSAPAASGQPCRVLDLGCGEARFAVELARAGLVVVAVDVAEEALRRARARHPALDLRVIPVAGAWPLQDAAFDVVWAGEVIEHVADTAAWMSELRRVLRPGGRLLLSTPDHGGLAMLGLALSGRAFDAHFDPRADHLRFYTRRTLRQLLEDFGFRDVDVRGAGGLPGARRVLLASALRSRF